MLLRFIYLLLSFSSVISDNTFYLSHVFGDGMVLQARIPSVIWGFAKTGAVITTRFNDQVYNTTTGGNFIWRQVLPSMNASSVPYNLFFSSSSGGSTVVLLDVLFGEVYICGGQSNMQMSLSAVFNSTEEIASAHYPNIRIFTVGQDTMSDVPISDLQTIEQPWVAVTPSTISNNDDFGYFSAICFFFARDLQLVLGKNVPIGVISNNWSGQCLQQWALPEINSECGLSYDPKIYNAMFRPYTVGPMSIAGFIWSQGECNADSNTVAYYNCAFPLFISSLRTQFNNSDMFFGFELLPAYIRDAAYDPASVPYEREAQLNGLTAGGNVAVCNAMDLGDPSAPHGSVHPRNKQAVGERLANAALALVYKYEKISYLNPTYESSSVIYQNLSIVVTITFKQVNNSSEGDDGKLVLLSSTVCPPSVPIEECAWDQIQTQEDGVWHNATSTLSSDSRKLILNITTAKPMHANATRGTFSPWPVVHLYSSSGLPALPWNEPIVNSSESCAIRVSGSSGSKYVYDLSSLEKQTSIQALEWIDMSSPPMYEYDFTFCTAKTKSCVVNGSSNSNLCATQLQSPFTEISFGQWNETWTEVEGGGGVQTTFIGEKCRTTNRQTTVMLLCTQQLNTTFISYVDINSPCVFTLAIELQKNICSTLPPTPPSPPTTQTPSSAPTTLAPTPFTPTPVPSSPTLAPTFGTACVVKVAGRAYDFTDLETRSAANPFAWIDNSTPPLYEYDLTFCRARMRTCNDSNICQISLASSAQYNNGAGDWQQLNWKVVDGGIQAQLNGSSCGPRAGVRQTILTLSCKELYNETAIVSVTEDSLCQYSMLVQLESAVCNSPTLSPSAPTSSAPTSPQPTAAPTSVAPTSLAPTPLVAHCAYDVGGWVYNLTSLEVLSAQQPFTFSDSLFNYNLTFCSSRAGFCSPSNICQMSRSTASHYGLGEWNDAWGAADGGIESVFDSGSPCKGAINRSTHVLLSCKDSVDRTTIVSVVERAGCEYSMVVDIPRSLCPPSPAPPQPTSAPTFGSRCVVTVGNASYDFTGLEAQSSQNPLIFADDNFEYDFAICRARSQHCQGNASNASICQLALNQPFETNLGEWNSRWTAVDGGFRSIFIGGPCDAGKTIQTTVTFVCKGNFNQTTVTNVSLTAPCQYAATIQLQSSVCFSAGPTPTPASPSSTNWASIIIIIAGAVLVVGAVVFLICRRKGLASEGYRPI